MENCPVDLPTKKNEIFNRHVKSPDGNWIFAPHPSKYWCAFFFPWHHWQESHASAPKNLREAEIFVGCREIPSAPAEQH